jgi:hypothetical protein
MLLQVTRPPQLRLVLSLGLVVTIAVLFWAESRIPSLNDKALMSGSIQLEDPMSFEALFPVYDSMPLWQKIVYTTINWVKTNQNGMTFGVLFGGAFLTFLRYLPRRSFSGWFANSALGMAIGAPLGVCVNCAAPIAKGIYHAGARAETTLSATGPRAGTAACRGRRRSTGSSSTTRARSPARWRRNWTPCPARPCRCC